MKAYIKAGLIVTGLLTLFSFGESVSLVRTLLQKVPPEEASHKNRYHYALYLPQNREALLSSLVEGAKEGAAKNDASLSVHTYDSSGTTLALASYTGVDGIIVCPDNDDQQMAVLLEKLRTDCIPLVLVNHIIPAEHPWPFVGTNNFDFGKKAAGQISSESRRSIKLAVIYSDKAPSIYAERELVEMGMKSVLGGSLSSPVSVQRTDMNPRDAEKIIYQLVRAQPELNVIVFTDEEDTLAGTQALIDLNLVGHVQIIGSGSDQAIQDYIRKGIIVASLVIDPRSIGNQAVTSLSELFRSGYTSNSVDTGIDVITRYNLARYRNSGRKS